MGEGNSRTRTVTFGHHRRMQPRGSIQTPCAAPMSHQASPWAMCWRSRSDSMNSRSHRVRHANPDPKSIRRSGDGVIARFLHAGLVDYPSQRQ